MSNPLTLLHRGERVIHEISKGLRPFRYLYKAKEKQVRVRP